MLLDRLAIHFASRRDALDVIGRFGNRFEHWAKWETAVALHFTSFIDNASQVNAIAVERDGCDVFVGANPWPSTGYPAPHDRDVWIELKCRATSDRGPSELARELVSDLRRLRDRKASQRFGHYLAIAIVVEHPRSGSVEDWIRTIVEEPELKNAQVRKIYVDQRYGNHENRVLAALIACSI